MINGMEGRKRAEKILEIRFKAMTKASEKRNLYKNVFVKFGIPIDRTETMINFRRELPEFSAFELYAVMSFVAPERIPLCFTEQEIVDFSGEKYKEEETPYVCEIDCVKVTDEQYIGVTDMQALMSLRKRNVIVYKEGEQRVFKIVHSGQVDVKRISVNRRAVAQIKDAMLKGIYIPDDITIRLPESTKYRILKGKIRIDEAPEGLNLIDGFHRWLAMCEINNEFPEFNMPMEIRLTTFDERMTQQYIFQKDQKTLMKKVDSATYDRYSLENMIVNRLNATDIIGGKIVRAGGIISFQDVVSILKRLDPVYKGVDETDLQFVNKMADRIATGMSQIMTARPEIMEDKWGMRRTAVIIYASLQDLPAEEMLSLTEYLEKESLKEAEVFKVSGTSLRMKAYNILKKATLEWKETRK